jgi:hypothetical protein
MLVKFLKKFKEISGVDCLTTRYPLIVLRLPRCSVNTLAIFVPPSERINKMIDSHMPRIAIKEE